MEDFSPSQRAFCVRSYYETHSIHHVRLCFQNFFSGKLLPTQKIILQWVSSFEETGDTLRKNNKKRENEENVDKIEEQKENVIRRLGSRRTSFPMVRWNQVRRQSQDPNVTPPNAQLLIETPKVPRKKKICTNLLENCNSIYLLDF